MDYSQQLHHCNFVVLASSLGVFPWGPSVWLAAMLNSSETPLFPEVTSNIFLQLFKEVMNWNSGNDISLFSSFERNGQKNDWQQMG